MMVRLRSLLRNTWVLAGLTLAIGALISGAAVWASNRDDGGDDDPPLAVATEGQDEAEIRRVIGRFVAALNADDRDELYALQTEAYRRVCSREDFDKLPDAGGVRSEGPLNVQIQGDIAGAGIRQTAPDGTETVAAVPLSRDDDGSWKLSAPSDDGCT
jgi:hypothetical protein